MQTIHFHTNDQPSSPFALGAAGIEFAFSPPVSLAGTSVMFQGFAIAPSAENGIFAATDAISRR